MYSEYRCITQFEKNETAIMFLLEKPSLVIVVFHQPHL